MKKTWREKFLSAKEAAVKSVEKDFADIPSGSRMLIATPKIFDEYIRQIPKGTFVPFQTMRKDIAATYHADNTCPLTTGIFVRIAAKLAYEQLQQGKKLTQITPFWRVVSPSSTLAKKLSCGIDFILKQQTIEGITKSLLTSKEKK